MDKEYNELLKKNAILRLIEEAERIIVQELDEGNVPGVLFKALCDARKVMGLKSLRLTMEEEQ